VTTSVFVLDDHEVLRRGLGSLLKGEEDLDLVGEAATAAEALATVPTLRPDVTLLDVRLPDGNGIDVCRQLLELLPDLRCLIYSGHIDRETLLEAVVVGASGVLLKSTSERELLTAIRRVADGEEVLDRALARFTMDGIVASNRDPLEALTAQETRVAALVAEGNSNQQIAEKLLLSEKTVKNYLSNILRKLEFSHRTQLAVWVTRRAAIGNGDRT